MRITKTGLRFLAILGFLSLALFSFDTVSAAQYAFRASVMAQEASQSAAQQPRVPAQYAATAMGQAGSAAGKTFGLKVSVDGITSDGQIQELLGTLKHKGASELGRAMDNMKDVGRVAPNSSVGTGVRVVQIRAAKNGGEHIVLVTNRPISFAELYQGTRSRDYPFGIVVLDVDTDGKGSGLFAPLCKIKFNKKNELEVEHYGQKPFRLTNVYLQK
jgi:hypothetical protein